MGGVLKHHAQFFLDAESVLINDTVGKFYGFRSLLVPMLRVTAIKLRLPPECPTCRLAKLLLNGMFSTPEEITLNLKLKYAEVHYTVGLADFSLLVL